MASRTFDFPIAQKTVSTDTNFHYVDLHGLRLVWGFFNGNNTMEYAVDIGNKNGIFVLRKPDGGNLFLGFYDGNGKKIGSWNGQSGHTFESGKQYWAYGMIGLT